MDEVRVSHNNVFNASPNSGLTNTITVPSAETTGSATPDTPATPAADANTDSEDITITVVNVNRDPVLSSIGDRTVTEGTPITFTVTEGSPLTFTVSANDLDNDTLAYSAGNLPSGAVFDETTATFTWTPQDGQNRTYPNVRFTVTENTTVERKSDYEDIMITVENADSGPDPDENIKLLLHCNQDLVDSSSVAHTVTPHGNTSIGASTAKFGAGSLVLDGTDDYVTTPSHADLDIFSSASENKTLDFWVKHDDFTKVEGYFGQFQDGNNVWQLFHRGGNGIRLYVRSGGTLAADTGYGGLITDAQWHHVALCKVGSEYGIYLDGTQVAHTSSVNTGTFGAAFDIGRAVATSGASVSIDGYMDEVRVSSNNIFNASPDSGLTDTIAVPNSEQ